MNLLWIQTLQGLIDCFVKSYYFIDSCRLLSITGFKTCWSMGRHMFVWNRSYEINPFQLHLGVKQAGIIYFILKLVKLKSKQNMMWKQIHTLLYQQIFLVANELTQWHVNICPYNIWTLARVKKLQLWNFITSATLKSTWCGVVALLYRPSCVANGMWNACTPDIKCHCVRKHFQPSMLRWHGVLVYCSRVSATPSKTDCSRSIRHPFLP